MNDGRISRGWRLTTQSWALIRETPALLVFPFSSALCMLAAAVILLGPWALDIGQHHSKAAVFVAMAVSAYPFTVISTYFSVALYLMANAVLGVAVLTILASMVTQMALAEVFRLAAFRYATGTGPTGPFSPDDMAAVFRKRRRWGLFG